MTNQVTKNNLGVRLLCHKCAYIKPPAELVNYGQYRLCRDCARKYENLKEKDQISNVEAFVIAE